MRLHASWIVASYAIGIIVGDIIAMILKPTFFENIIWVILSILILVFAILISKPATVVASLFAGILLIFNRSAPIFISKNYTKTLIGENITITAQVIKDPEENAGKKKLTLKNEALGKLSAEVPRADIKRSDFVTISGKLNEGSGSFAGYIYQPSVEEISRPEPGDLFLKFRDFFADGIKKHLPTKEAGLGIGYLLGQKSGVDKSFQESLRTVGLTHIIVASGAHLGALIGFARKIFGRFSRLASLLSGGIFTLLFIGITGLSASMLRAGLVTGLSLIAWYFGRKIHPVRVILLAAAATLVVSPEFLLDMAWQLSFASFSGILVIAPIFIRIFHGKNQKPGFLSGTLISSAAAALLCTPILIYDYGSVSLISIFVNLLVLPTVSFAMGLTFLTGFSAIFMPFLADFISFVNKMLLDYQIWIVEFFGSKKEFLLELPKNNPLVFLAYVPIIGFTVFWLIKIRRQEIKCLRLRNFA